MAGVVEAFLRRQGFALPNDKMRKMQQLWMSWYRGEAIDKAHLYTVRYQDKPVVCERRRLGMAKVVCEDFGSLLINEHVQINCDGFDELPNILSDNEFYTRMNRLAEITMATGTGAVVEFIDETGTPTIDYIRAEMVHPLSWDGDRVDECAFCSKKTVAREDGTTEEICYVQIHRKTAGGWQIENHWLKSNGDELPLPDGLAALSPNSPVPLFQLVRPNTINTADIDSPLGASVFADAQEQLIDCDIIWDSYINEYVLGKKRLLMPLELTQLLVQHTAANSAFAGDATEQEKLLMQPVFDPSDTLIYTYSAKDGDKPIELDMKLRVDEHDKGLQRAIDLLSKKCGLGMGRYQIDGGGVKTATEVISEKSDLYQSLKRHEKPFGDAIVGMVKALAFLVGKTAEDITVKFDDSIIEDAAATLDRQIKMVNNGLQSKLRAMMAVHGITEDEAQKRLEEIAAEEKVSADAAEQAMFGGLG